MTLLKYQPPRASVLGDAREDASLQFWAMRLHEHSILFNDFNRGRHRPSSTELKFRYF